MELFQNLANVFVPPWVRTLIVLALTTLLGFCLFLTVGALLDSAERPDWIEASFYLIGVLLPLLLIVFVVSFAQGDAAHLRHRTDAFLTRLLPQTLAFFDNPQPAFSDPGSSRRSRRIAPKTKVRVRKNADSCIALYDIELPGERGFRVWMKAELNVRKINIVLYVPKDRGEREAILNALRHSIEGAAAEGYKVNPAIGESDAPGFPCWSVVLIRQLDDAFLISSRQQLYYAQDLLFFLRAVVGDAPQLFIAREETV